MTPLEPVALASGSALDVLATRHAYVAFALLLCVGLYMMIANPNLVKKIIGLNLFQTAIFLLFIASGYVEGGAIPIVADGAAETETFVSPLPHVIVLTAIVVGVSLTAVGLALCIRIYDEYGTLHTGTLRELMRDEGSLPAGPSDEDDADASAAAAAPKGGASDD
ncbi:cation:proton antiporter subunit C [Halorubrum sp. AD140]|uniref:cation:proton antiporter subunit C n=1 Tax=Halorubrum sp. AD140 TaxID=3050073 RepID=UPI002ACC53E8|nr:cation:proton antiporter subunit C [Halorubrum sp. AD140]MDZ5810141.1 cation:proton antiporter subunit C [Halorubrum sp. AD140]